MEIWMIAGLCVTAFFLLCLFGAWGMARAQNMTRKIDSIDARGNNVPYRQLRRFVKHKNPQLYKEYHDLYCGPGEGGEEL